MLNMIVAPLRKLFRPLYSADGVKMDMPYSAQRSQTVGNEARPFTIDRDAHGSRPWHTYAKKSK
ncbi:MAG: hypothetical protein COB84_04070 [Rhodobacteraceae bacterium]|nr:MAG: hypothetical protein COB84_04070 [Paracoccaceae bacterium]